MALPASYTLRAPRTDDGPRVVAMLNEESIALAGAAVADANWVTAPWTAPGAELDRDFGVIEAATGELAGYFMLDPDPAGRSVFAVGCVALGHHGRGLGTAIVGEIERRAQSFVAMASGHGSPTLRLGALSDEPQVSALLGGRGFVEVIRMWEMRIVFDGPPALPQPVPGIRIRTVQAGEEPTVYDCLAEAFEDHWNGLNPKPRWLHRHVQVDTFDRTLWFVALERDRIVGALVGRLASVEEPRLGDVNTLGVRRPARGRGVGEALLRAAFAAFAARGQHGALLHVDSDSPTGATRLYERVGMTAQPRFSTWEKRLAVAERS
jgi:mycothiol synthase